MEFLPQESKPGFYNVFENAAGERYVVLRDLNVELIKEPSSMETFMLEYYEPVAIGYTILLLFIFVYLTGYYFLAPLYSRWKQNLPLFGAQ